MVETLRALIGVAVGLAGVAQWLSSGEQSEERMIHLDSGAGGGRPCDDRTRDVGG